MKFEVRRRIVVGGRADSDCRSVVESVTYFCPAKINVFLAVTGRRDDGFHELVSVVLPISFGDELAVRPAADGVYSLSCDDPAVPLGDGNLILRAARAFAAASGWGGGALFHLRKRVPMGAGLGGGSSDAAMALRALNVLAGAPLSLAQLQVVAAEVGSDCPLFLEGGPVIMRGRGERLERLPETACARWAGRRLMVFKPDFGIETAWAYRTLAAGAPRGYLPQAEAEARVQGWLDAPEASVDELGFNSLEVPAFAKFLALPTLLAWLAARHGVRGRMSGSGSACYAFLEEDCDPEAVVATVREAWGPTALCTVTTLWRDGG